MPKKARQPFEIRLKGEQREDLALELARALDDALSARTASEAECQYFHALYEQGRTRTASNSPWPDAADLTSYLGTQYVDVLRSQIVKSVMSEPVWTVEGYGDAEQKAPFVEEFHQWQQEAEGFQMAFARAVHLALIEPVGWIEVYEDTIKRPVRSVQRVAIQLNPADGSALVDEKLNPIPMTGPNGQFVQVFDDVTPSTEVEVDTYETVCRGPRERSIAYRDAGVLPGHAREKSEIWGYWKRFWRRLDELQERAEAGIYDKDAVEELGTDDERTSDTTLAGENIEVAAKTADSEKEKELYELLILKDLDGKGLRWFVVTLHKDKRQILRLQYDDIGRPRYFPLVPFPRPNSWEGYSYIGHKLITVIEEHTAVRNLRADSATMTLNAPILRATTALWDPEAEPIGPKAVIPVRRMDEVQRMELGDNTGPAVEWLNELLRAGERLSGINDAVGGITSQEKRTATEVSIFSEQSLGRVTEAIKNIQEPLEEIAQVRHLMWKRALAEFGQEGLEAPPSVSQAILMRQNPMPQAPNAIQATGVLMGTEQRAPDIMQAQPNVKFTAQMLEGNFRFKPRGSVENASRQAQQMMLAQFFQALASMAAVNPMVGMLLSTPQAAKALVEQAIRAYGWTDKQAFLGSEAMAAVQQMQMQQMLGMMGGPPPPAGGSGAPGGPPLSQPQRPPA